jgi:hypothetical protein
MNAISLGKFTRTALALSIGCLVAVGAIAAEAGPVSKPELIAGRWILAHVKGTPQTIDITKCGEKWCGIEVDANGKCGRVALRLTAGNHLKEDAQFIGQYSAADGAESYAIGGMIWEDKGEVTLAISGHTGADFQPFRRMYPLNMHLSRKGDAVCKADAKVS